MAWHVRPFGSSDQAAAEGALMAHGTRCGPLRWDPSTGGFNEHVRAALRRSPWWMVSASAHLVLLILSTLLGSSTVSPLTPPALSASIAPSGEVADLEPPPDPLEVVRLHDPDGTVHMPKFVDAPLDDFNQSENDLPVVESLGAGGLAEAPFEGPSSNGIVGTRGGGGAAFVGGGSSRRLSGSCGGRLAQDAVDEALSWLKVHQSPDGGWECEGFRRWCDGKAASGPGPDGAGKVQYDVGVTGLALLAFLGAGYTQRSDDSRGFGKCVAACLRHLKSVQDPEGCFGDRSSGHHVYGQAIATLAMVEAYGMTESSVYKGPAQKALDFIVAARSPGLAWRYGIKPRDGDTSVTGWMMMALQSAKWINAAAERAGHPRPLDVDEGALEGVRAWVEKMTDPASGRVGYQSRGTGPARPADLIDRFPASKSESMTGVGMLARVFLGEDPRTSEPIKRGAALCGKSLPSWNPSDGSIDMYYWYYATLAMFQVGGEPWKHWNEAMQKAIVATQRRDGDHGMYRGSWDPIDPWGGDGGRVYSTACLTLCLEVYYRYDKVFGVREEGR